MYAADRERLLRRTFGSNLVQRKLVVFLKTTSLDQTVVGFSTSKVFVDNRFVDLLKSERKVNINILQLYCTGRTYKSFVGRLRSEHRIDHSSLALLQRHELGERLVRDTPRGAISRRGRRVELRLRHVEECWIRDRPS